MPQRLARAAALTAGILGARGAHAQYVPNYFPAGVPGYGESLGVTVVSRVKPLYEEAGMRIGSFIIHGDLDESVGYNSNVLGFSGSPGSAVVETAPSISINSDWSRNALGASFSVDDQRYLNTASQNRTDWNAAIGGAYTIGRGDLTLAYSHANEHESPTDIGAPPTGTPIPYTDDDFRTSYTFDLGRVKITPNFEYSLYRFGTADVIGQPANQSFRDSNIAQGGAAFRYELSDQRSLLLVFQGINATYIHPQANQLSLNSTSGLVLAGIDYQYNGVWRYQFLAGVEARHFSASQFGTRVAPIVKAAVIWTPTGLTTVTGTLLRTLDEPIEEGTSGFTYNSAELRLDHELRRNVLLNGELGTKIAQYQQGGGTQTQYYASVGASWLLNRRMRLGLQYTFTRQNSSSGAENTTPLASNFGALINGDYSQNLIMVTLHVGL
jgi:hypothetical protein